MTDHRWYLSDPRPPGPLHRAETARATCMCGWQDVRHPLDLARQDGARHVSRHRGGGQYRQWMAAAELGEVIYESCWTSGPVTVCIPTLSSRSETLSVLIEAIRDGRDAPLVRAVIALRVDDDGKRPVDLRGAARSRNALLDLVQTTAVAFTDDDDWPLPGWLSRSCDWLGRSQHKVIAARWAGTPNPAGASVSCSVGWTEDWRRVRWRPGRITRMAPDASHRDEWEPDDVATANAWLPGDIGWPPRYGDETGKPWPEVEHRSHPGQMSKQRLGLALAGRLARGVESYNWGDET